MLMVVYIHLIIKISKLILFQFQKANGKLHWFTFHIDPLGNIMGKTFHKFGMSYGWEGLFYKYRNHMEQTQKIFYLPMMQGKSLNSVVMTMTGT